MKFYFSPLFLFSTAIFLYAAYLLSLAYFYPLRWTAVLAPQMILTSITGIAIHFIFKKIFGKNVRMQLQVELVLTSSIVFFIVAITFLQTFFAA